MSRLPLKKLLFLSALGLMPLFARLPYSLQMAFGRLFARIAFLFVKRRKKIAAANLKLCFPKSSDSERHLMLKGVFQSTGMGAMETIMAWWMPAKKFSTISFRLHGYEHVLAAKDKGAGIILLGAHFSCLEIIGRYFGEMSPFSLVYKKHRNAFFENIMAKSRLKYTSRIIDSNNMRQVIRDLRAGGIVWYCPDQDFGMKMSIMAPFFDVPTATLNTTGKLAKVGRATVLPVFFNRIENNTAYEITCYPPLNDKVENDSDEAYTRAYNKLLESHIRQHPDQYHWVHRRFKTRPEGFASIYNCLV